MGYKNEEKHMAVVLGIDVGTTGTKAILTDENMQVIASAYKDYSFIKNGSGFIEQNAYDWWRAVVCVIRECVKEYDNKEDIKGICVSSQGATLVCVDDNGEPLAPAVVWMDGRADRQGESINERFGKNYVYKKTGWRSLNCFNLLQILWIKDNNKILYESTYKFLSTNEYINYKLSGEFVGDPTNAGISQLFNIIEKRWDKDLLALCGIDESRLSYVVDSGKPVGRISKQAAKQLGLSENTVIYNSGWDQYLAAVGSGAVKNGDVLLSCGTSWGITHITDAPYFNMDDYYAPGRHVIDGIWGVFAYTPAGGATLEWYRKNIGLRKNDNTFETFENINELASDSGIGAKGLMFMPHFSGTSCPTWSSKSRATLMGMNISHERADIIRAFMEGVGFEINWILETVKKAGLQSNCIKSLGGATRSRIWMQIVSDITGLTVMNPAYADAPVIGAVVMAGVGCGVFDNVAQALDVMKKDVAIIKPNLKAHNVYQELFEEYKRRFEFLRQCYEKND